MSRLPAGIDRIPAPRNDEERLLLQLIWREAAERDWPTFRTVDMNLDKQGIDIVEVLSRLSPQLVVGWPDSRPHEPSPDTLLRLTVAGVAHCPGTADVIDAFVTLVQTLARIEEHWPASGSQPVRLDSDNAQAATGLPARAELKELLRLGFFLTREEPWCVYSGSRVDPYPLLTFVVSDDDRPEIAPPDHWRDNVGVFGWELGVDRRVRAFRGVEDIGDYWSRRSRQLAWVDRPVPAHQAPPVRELFTPWHVNQPSLPAQAALLVLWLAEKTGEDILRYEDPEPFAQEQQFSSSRLQTVLAYAQQQGAVDVLQTLRRCIARLTITGVARMEELLRARNSRSVRFDYLTSALVEAAMATYPHCRLVMEDFLASVALCLYRDRLTAEEAFRAAEYLGEKGLAVLERGDGDLHALHLSGMGIDAGYALEDRKSMREFMDSQPYIIIRSNVNHGTQAIGANQTVNVHGAPATELAAFAREVLTAARSADIPDEQRSQLIDSAQQLAAEADGPTQEPSRTRALIQRIREALTQSATEVFRQELVETAHRLL
ncbi:hypothetical protein [Streptomyces pseudovenezuelae]|uniref:hypothetical protein n=1 Tax=Streptomyces pseudovenezuelae TaxID=67350 RepID=UPI002E81827A|nr:hypothetical protein [Streptomyces pseudovenezuelae]WUA85806.1 hypothetical protein OHO81_00105 [Streptomyces pseudovenezuelae]WUA93959.1 hypothetical protein OHO81_44505 [Streptomyces pseudovenezuelae]